MWADCCQVVTDGWTKSITCCVWVFSKVSWLSLQICITSYPIYDLIFLSFFFVFHLHFFWLWEGEERSSRVSLDVTFSFKYGIAGIFAELFLSTKAGNGAGPVSERGTDGLTNPLSILVTPDLAWISPHQSSPCPLHANVTDSHDRHAR